MREDQKVLQRYTVGHKTREPSCKRVTTLTTHCALQRHHLSNRIGSIGAAFKRDCKLGFSPVTQSLWMHREQKPQEDFVLEFGCFLFSSAESENFLIGQQRVYPPQQKTKDSENQQTECSNEKLEQTSASLRSMCAMHTA